MTRPSLASFVRFGILLTAGVAPTAALDAQRPAADRGANDGRSAAQDEAAFRAERAKYEAYLSRPSLRKRTDGRIYFAQTGDPRALEVLVKSYSKPEEPVDHNKYLIATIAMDQFGSSADDELLEDWRRKHRKPVDAWMWFETLRLKRMESRREELLSIITGRESPYLRGAAFAAMVELTNARTTEPELANWALLRLDALPDKPLERAIELESIAALLHKKKRHIRDPESWLPVCRKLIETTFAPDTSPRRSMVTVARYLSLSFDVQNLGFDPYFWLGELDRSEGKSRAAGQTTATGFAGIRTKGDNIVYVIDASDSMLRRVSNLAKKSEGPTTGAEVEVEEGKVPTADDLDWGRIQTRFDAAREFLRVALETLEPEHRFSIILFGDEAIALEATPTLMPASPQVIRKAIKELSEITPGPPTGDRPDGQLRGKTNLHGGIRLAYRMTRSGITNKAEFADEKSMIEGCDTVFILSDGAPSTDDWYALDAPEEKDRAGDPESGIAQTKSPQMWFDGPYGQLVNNYLVEDVERMNLLRRCEIHCVGIGEADNQFLGRVAAVGRGQSIRIDSRVEDGK